MCAMREREANGCKGRNICATHCTNRSMSTMKLQSKCSSDLQNRGWRREKPSTTEREQRSTSEVFSKTRKYSTTNRFVCYPVIGAPPSFAGAFQLNVNETSSTFDVVGAATI